MSIASNFPAISPSLSLDFAAVQQLDPRITFTRASTATYYGTQTAKAEENLLLQSQDFTTSWVNSNSTDAANTATAPDGTTTADTLTDNATSGTHSVYQSVSVLANTTYVVSCFMKAGTSDYAILAFTDASAAQRYFSAEFNLDTGVVSRTANGSSGTLTSSSITSVGNGWYRCVIIGQASAVSAGNRIYVGVSDGSSALGSFGIGSYVGTDTTIEIWGAQLEQRDAVTAYTATTTQAITNYIPVLETAASGVARFDHNPTTFESLGLLIEESRTNLVTYSEQFDDAAWAKTESTVVSNTIVAPDGAITGDKLVDSTTANQSHFLVSNSVSFTSGTAYTLTCYAKAGERNGIRLQFNSGAFGASVAYRFDLTSGVATLITAGTGTSASATAVGNGWYRCSMTAQATITASRSVNIYIVDNSGATVYTGDGYSGIYIWGAQLESSSFSTSYIPTVASQVTRSADAASMTGTNFSSWYNQAEGTFFSSVVLNQTPAQLNSQVIFAASDNTNSNRVIVSLGSGSSGNINALVTTGGVTQAQTINGSLSTAGAYQYANAYKVNDFASVANGGVAATDTSGTIPVVDRLYLGVNSSGTTTSLTATIKKIAYYPLRMTNAQLQGLTS